MRVFTPIALFLIVASASGCSHRRACQHFGFRPALKSTADCAQCQSGPNVVGSSLSESASISAPPSQLNTAPSDESLTAPPYDDEPDHTFQEPVVGEFPEPIPNIVETPPETPATPQPPKTPMEASSSSAATPAEVPTKANKSPQTDTPTTQVTTDPDSKPAAKPAAKKPAKPTPADVPEEIPFEKIEPPKPTEIDAEPTQGLLKEPKLDDSTNSSTESLLANRLTLGNPNNTFTPDNSEKSVITPEPTKPTRSTIDDNSFAPVVPQKQSPRRRVTNNLSIEPLEIQRPAVEPSPALTTEPKSEDELVVLRAATSIYSMRNTRVTNPDGHRVADQQVEAQATGSTQRITESTELDPVYGLPLGNRVDFAQLPKLNNKAAQQHTGNHGHAGGVQSHLVKLDSDGNHVHVHIHRGFMTSTQSACDCQQCKANTGHGDVKVVYTDADGRSFVAPPTNTYVQPAQPESAGSLEGGRQLGNRATYYLPPRQILRLKASTDFNRPKPQPSVASIQMRDTVIVGGAPLLAQPIKDASAQHERVKQEVEVDEIREALKRLATEKQLR